MRRIPSPILTCSAVVALAVVALGSWALWFRQGFDAEYRPGEAVTRRLTPSQYRTIITDVFGPTIQLGGRFEPDLRIEGLLAVGTSQVSVSAAGMEQYDGMARNIAEQVTGVAHRDMLIACKPAAADTPDDRCARRFLSEAGRLLFRRPLSQVEERTYVTAARAAGDTLHDFYAGLSLSLASMLASPQFLFRTETLVPDTDSPSGYRLDDYSIASRLSFFLWDSSPDPALLEAAGRGELRTARGLQRQVQRMIASTRVEAGVRAFFTDMFRFDEFETLTKDPVLFPKFSPNVAADSQEQTLRTVVDLLVADEGDYRDIFTTRKTFLTQSLASIYRVPLVNERPNGSPDQWLPYEFPADDPRAGVLMQTSFVSLHSHPGRGSPTLRGKALREIMLCQKIPAPPAQVDFTIVQDTTNPVHRTARERLSAHATQPSCTGCHKVMDPMGLALENFDSAGEWRTTENGKRIDTSGKLDAVAFQDGAGLGRAVRDNPATPSCLVDRLSAYAVGRTLRRSEKSWSDQLKQEFAAEGFRVPALMREIASSPEFYLASQPGAVPALAKTAHATSSPQE